MAYKDLEGLARSLSNKIWVLWPPSFHYIHCSLTVSLFSLTKKKKELMSYHLDD